MCRGSITGKLDFQGRGRDRLQSVSVRIHALETDPCMTLATLFEAMPLWVKSLGLFLAPASHGDVSRVRGDDEKRGFMMPTQRHCQGISQIKGRDENRLIRMIEAKRRNEKMNLILQVEVAVKG